MSIPSSPRYKDLDKALHEFISYHSQMLNNYNSSTEETVDYVKEVFQDVFECVKTVIDVKSDLSSRDIKQLSEKVSIDIKELFATRDYHETPTSEKDKYKALFSDLKEELDTFEQVMNHQKEIDQHGLDHFLNESWGWQQLEQLAKIGNDWALTTLKKLVVNGNSQVYPFLIRSHSYLSMQPLLLELKGNLSLVKHLRTMLAKDVESKKIAISFIGFILKNDNWTLGQKILEERFEDPFVSSTIRDVFLSQADPKHSMNRFISEKLFQEHPLGIDCFAALFSIPNVKANALAPPLIKMAFEKKSVNFDMLLLAFAALSYPKSELLRAVVAILDSLEAQRGVSEGSYKKIFIHLKNKRLELIQAFESSGRETENFWKMPADFAIARIYQLFALRQHQLIHYLHNGQAVTSESFESVQELFPKAQAVFMGWDASHEKLFFTLSDLLMKHGIEVHSSVPPGDQEMFVDHPSLNKWVSPYSIGPWMQDYCFVMTHQGENFIQYPYWSSFDESFSEIPHRRLQARFPEEYQQLELEEVELPVLGAVLQKQIQLHFFINFIRNNSKWTNHRFQFTFNEGGNCLIGKNKEGAFAIIGKDSLEINKRILTKEIATLGLKKGPNGEWKLEMPYSEQELDLTEDDIKVFFSQDLAIDAKRIYFIEQPDFHLDMAMCLLNDKTVALNDSALVYQKLKSKYELEYEKNEVLEKRLKFLEQIASKKQLLENAAAIDLEEQGFKVIRFAGAYEDIFQNHPENHRTNLFNYISFTDAKNQKVIVAMGCLKEDQESFTKMIGEQVDTSVDTHFLDQEQSEALLKIFGGVHCATKCLPWPLSV